MTDALSEARVVVGRYQQITSVDLTETSQIAQGSLDNVVETFLGDGYTGLTVGANTAGTGVVVQTGFLAQGGQVYGLPDVFPVDLSSKIASIPDATKTMIVLIVAYGDESQTSETRTFEDASKKPTNPADLWPTVQTYVATRVVRTIDVSAVAGNADVQPQPPAVNAKLEVLATVVLSQAGIKSVTQSTAGQIVTQQQIAATLSSVNTYVSSLQTVITGLLSSVSALALQLTALNAREQADVVSLQSQINALKTTATAAPTASFTGVDHFTDLSQSSPTATGYNALVSGGLRFPVAQKTDIPIAAQNPFASVLKQGSGTLLVPSWGAGGIGPSTGVNTLGGIGFEGAPTFGQLGFASLPVARRGFPRLRIQSSIGLTTQAAPQVLANGDPSQLFAIDPSTFVYDQTDWGAWQTDTTEIVRQNGFWSTLASRDYWSPIVGAIGNTGGLPIVAQPFKMTSTLMCPGMFLIFGTYADVPAANLRILICADNAGSPDLMHTYLDMQTATTAFQAHQLNVNFPVPVLLRSGKTYHLVVTSDNPALTLSMYPTNGLPALSYSNGSWQVFNSGYGLNVSFGICNFGNGTTITVPLGTLNLATGSDTLDFQFGLLLPEGCSLIIQVLIGGTWLSLAQVLNSTYPLSGNPQTVQCQMVLTTNYGVAPIIDTSVSAARISKAGTALEHVSSVQTPAAPVTTIHKSVTIDNWVGGAVQTLSAGLRTGPGFTGAPVAPTATKDTSNADGSLTRNWTWSLGAAVPSFEMELDGATTDTTKQYVVRDSNWDASP